MKNQYFGDVNDYRKYGLLRQLAGQGELHLGICWMLTPNDTGPDGNKTAYLEDRNRTLWRSHDAALYDFLHCKIKGNETQLPAREVSCLSELQIPGSSYYTKTLVDNRRERELYFSDMWKQFQNANVEMIFFDPDDGLANNFRSVKPQRIGHKKSSKKLFREEINQSLERNFSVILYQHFDRTERTGYVATIGKELAEINNMKQSFSFWTPHVVFFLVPHPNHFDKVEAAVERVRLSSWAGNQSCRTSKKNGYRHILVGTHKP